MDGILDGVDGILDGVDGILNGIGRYRMVSLVWCSVCSMVCIVWYVLCGIVFCMVWFRIWYSKVSNLVW